MANRLMYQRDKKSVCNEFKPPRKKQKIGISKLLCSKTNIEQQLPYDILVIVFSLLNPGDILYTLPIVSKSVFRLINDNVIYYLRLKHDFGSWISFVENSETKIDNSVWKKTIYIDV